MKALIFALTLLFMNCTAGPVVTLHDVEADFLRYNRIADAMDGMDNVTFNKDDKSNVAGHIITQGSDALRECSSKLNSVNKDLEKVMKSYNSLIDDANNWRTFMAYKWTAIIIGLLLLVGYVAWRIAVFKIPVRLP